MGEMANRMLSVPLATLVTCSDGGGTGEVPLLPLLGPYKDVMLIAQSSVYSDDSMRSLCTDIQHRPTRRKCHVCALQPTR